MNKNKIGAFDFIDRALVDKYNELQMNNIDEDIKQLSMTAERTMDVMNMLGRQLLINCKVNTSLKKKSNA